LDTIEERLDSRFIPNYGGGLPEGKEDCKLELIL